MIGSMIGIGGGVMIVPFLTRWGIPQKQAQGTSLFVITSRLPLCIAAYWILGNIDWSFALPLSTGGLIGALIGARLAQSFDNRRLSKAFGIFLIITALLTLVSMWFALPQHPVALSVPGFLTITVLSALGGLISGFFGVGGGVVFVPLGNILGGLPQVISQGSAFVAGLPTTFAGWITYFRGREFDLSLAKWLVPGALVGTIVGALAADILWNPVLTVIFFLFILILGIRQLQNGLVKE